MTELTCTKIQALAFRWTCTGNTNRMTRTPSCLVLLWLLGSTIPSLFQLALVWHFLLLSAPSKFFLDPHFDLPGKPFIWNEKVFRIKKETKKTEQNLKVNFKKLSHFSKNAIGKGKTKQLNLNCYTSRFFCPWQSELSFPTFSWT